MDAAKEVLSRINYRSFYQRNLPGFKLNGGKEVLTLCPFHDDKEPSFSVNVENGLFCCHACGESGNAIQFFQKKEGLGVKEAVKKLREEEGIEDITPNPNPLPMRGEGIKKKGEGAAKKPTYLSLEQIKLLHNQLVKNEKPLKTFKERYGLSIETIEKHLLGYQNERFVIPMEVEPGKYFYKEHKGNQSRGAKVTLYPGEILNSPQPPLTK